MKKLCIVVLMISPSPIFSMYTHKTPLMTDDVHYNQNRKSFDEHFDDYDPCIQIMKYGIITALEFCKETYQQIQLLNRALNAADIKVKRD